jgi:hypothetical protein
MYTDVRRNGTWSCKIWGIYEPLFTSFSTALFSRRQFDDVFVIVPGDKSWKCTTHEIIERISAPIHAKKCILYNCCQTYARACVNRYRTLSKILKKHEKFRLLKPCNTYEHTWFRTWWISPDVSLHMYSQVTKSTFHYSIVTRAIDEAKREPWRTYLKSTEWLDFPLRNYIFCL